MALYGWVWYGVVCVLCCVWGGAIVSVRQMVWPVRFGVCDSWVCVLGFVFLGLVLVWCVFLVVFWGLCVGVWFSGRLVWCVLVVV